MPQIDPRELGMSSSLIFRVCQKLDLIFPENIDIGVINSFEKKQGGYFNVSVKLHEDFNKLYFVYIVKSLNYNEKIQLEKNTNE